MWYSLRRSAGFARRGWLCKTADARRQTADAYRQTCEWWYMVEWRALHHPRLLVRQCKARQRACCIGDCSGDGASWSGGALSQQADRQLDGQTRDAGACSCSSSGSDSGAGRAQRCAAVAGATVYAAHAAAAADDVAHGSSVVGTLARHGSAPWPSAWVARSASPMQHGSLHASSV